MLLFVTSTEHSWLSSGPLKQVLTFSLDFVKTIETQKVEVAPLQKSASPTSSVRRTQTLLT